LLAIALIAGQHNEVRLADILTHRQYAKTLANKYEIDWALARRIIQCESSWKADAVNHDAVVGKDVGYWQINTYYHQARALGMGYDISQPTDNLEYGFYLLDAEGTQPWKWSRECWSAKMPSVRARQDTQEGM